MHSIKSFDDHFKAIAAGAFSAYYLSEILPEGDIKDELRNILLIQCDIINCLIEGNHFGSRELKEFIDYASERAEEAQTIKNTYRN